MISASDDSGHMWKTSILTGVAATHLATSRFRATSVSHSPWLGFDERSSLCPTLNETWRDAKCLLKFSLGSVPRKESV